jgi:hypothetical protein
LLLVLAGGLSDRKPVAELGVVAGQVESSAELIEEIFVSAISAHEEDVFDLLDGDLVIVAEQFEEVLFVAVGKGDCFPDGLAIEQVLYFFLDHLIELFLDWEGDFLGFLRLVFLSLDEEGEVCKDDLAVGGPFLQEEVDAFGHQGLLGGAVLGHELVVNVAD